MDLVIPLGRKCGWGDYEELRYALRSAEQYVPDLDNLFVVGHKPAWLPDKYHISHPDPYRSNKDANLIQKILRACIEPSLSDSFIRMSDDQLFLSLWEPSRRYHLGKLGPDSFNKMPQKWYNRLRNTYRALRQHRKRVGMEGWEIYNYDAHIPMLYEKKLYVEVMTQYDYGAGPGMCINTLYGNHLSGRPENMPAGVRMGVSGPSTYDKLQKMASEAKFCNYVDKGLSDHFKHWIRQEFPEPSRFEQ